MIAFAGLYELWRDAAVPDDDPDAWLWTATMITTSAPDELGQIHDRMPMVIEPASWADWLDPATPTRATCGRCWPRPPARGLVTYPVSPAVNSVRNNGPELMQPVAAAAGAGPGALVGPGLRSKRMDVSTARKRLEETRDELDRSIMVLQDDRPLEERGEFAPDPADAGSNLSETERTEAVIDGGQAAAGRGPGRAAPDRRRQLRDLRRTAASPCPRAGWRPSPRPRGAWPARESGTGCDADRRNAGGHAGVVARVSLVSYSTLAGPSGAVARAPATAGPCILPPRRLAAQQGRSRRSRRGWVLSRRH